MPKATIANIAARAGVSTATVDRVLNHREGVSAVNRQRVLAAAADLGLLPGQGRAAFPARPVRLEFFIPLAHQAFLSEVAATIERFAATLPLVASTRITRLADFQPETLVDALGQMSLRTHGVGLVAVDHPITRQAVRTLVDNNVQVITIASDLLATPRAAYVGLDDRIAGRTAALVMGRMAGARMSAGYKSGGGRGKVGLMIGQSALHGQRERESGFRTVMASEFSHIEVLPTFDTISDNTGAQAAATDLLAREADLIGLYCPGGGRRGIAQAVAAHRGPHRPFVIMHDLSDSTRQFLADGVVDLVIDQNARLVAEQAVIRLLGAIAADSHFLPLHYIEPRLIFRENIPLH